jgi:hypothetical protein
MAIEEKIELGRARFEAKRIFDEMKYASYDYQNAVLAELRHIMTQDRKKAVQNKQGEMDTVLESMDGLA